MPSSAHTRKFTIRTPKSRRLVINIDVPMDGISSVLALGASKFKGAGHTTQASARKTPNDVGFHARLKMPRGMLLERAISTDQARPSSKLGRLEVLHR